MHGLPSMSGPNTSWSKLNADARRHGRLFGVDSEQAAVSEAELVDGPGRPLDRQGAHVRRINKKSVGICLIGGMNSAKDGAEENYTDEQWKALRETIDDLKENHFPDAQIRGHVDFDKGKTCPNFDAEHWYETAEIISNL